MKGFSISLLVAVILVIAAVAMIYYGFSGNVIGRPPTPEPQQQGCNINDDCFNNENGTLCLIIYKPGNPMTPYCGCIYDNDCTEGVCIENKCT